MIQVGGALAAYRGGRRPEIVYRRSKQRGGGILSVLKRFAVPLARSAARTVLPHVTRFVESALSGEDLKTAAIREAKSAGSDLLQKGISAATSKFVPTKKRKARPASSKVKPKRAKKFF